MHQIKHGQCRRLSGQIYAAGIVVIEGFASEDSE
jgi:hypothetical protein